MLDITNIKTFEVRLPYDLVLALPLLKGNQLLTIPSTQQDDVRVASVACTKENDGSFCISINGNNVINLTNDTAVCDITSVKLPEESQSSNKNYSLHVEETSNIEDTSVADSRPSAIFSSQPDATITHNVQKRKRGRPRKAELCVETENIPKEFQSQEENEEPALGRPKRLRQKPKSLEVMEDFESLDHKLQMEMPLKQCPLCEQEFTKLYKHVKSAHKDHPNSEEVLSKVASANKEKTDCNECGKIVTVANLLRHKTVFHGSGTERVHCKICNKAVATNYIKAHMKTVHAPEGTTLQTCDICGRKVASLQGHMTRVHYKSSDQHLCHKCSFQTHDRYTLGKHVLFVHDNVRNFACEICGSTFKTRNSLSFHISVVHEGERKFECDVCTKKFTKKYHLGIHKRIHTGEKPFTCTYCSKAFIDKSNLGAHIEAVHLHIFRFKCTNCGIGFRRRKMLLEHMACFHSDTEKSDKDTGSTPVTREFNLQGLQFTMLSSLPTFPQDGITSQADVGKLYITQNDPNTGIKLYNVPVQCDNEGAGQNIQYVLPNTLEQSILSSQENTVVLPPGSDSSVVTGDSEIMEHVTIDTSNGHAVTEENNSTEEITYESSTENVTTYVLFPPPPAAAE